MAPYPGCKLHHALKIFEPKTAIGPARPWFQGTGKRRRGGPDYPPSPIHRPDVLEGFACEACLQLLRFLPQGHAQGFGNPMQGGARQAKIVPLPFCIIHNGTIQGQE